MFETENEWLAKEYYKYHICTESQSKAIMERDRVSSDSQRRCLG